jgi:hypothetical protein
VQHLRRRLPAHQKRRPHLHLRDCCRTGVHASANCGDTCFPARIGTVAQA